MAVQFSSHFVPLPTYNHTQYDSFSHAMPAAEAPDGEESDGVTFERHGGLDGGTGAVERDQGALDEESATQHAAETPRATAAASGAGAAAREAAAAPPAPGLDPASGPESSSEGTVATNAGEVSAGDPLTGDGDSDPQRGEPSGGAGAASARAMVRDDDELNGDGQPKRITLQNYASRDSGAVMLESSPLSKGMPNLLLDSKDKYAITPCEQQQWAVLGLSEDILVKTIIVGSHEKYSSLLKEFQVRSVSHTLAAAVR